MAKKYFRPSDGGGGGVGGDISVRGSFSGYPSYHDGNAGTRTRGYLYVGVTSSEARPARVVCLPTREYIGPRIFDSCSLLFQSAVLFILIVYREADYRN